MSHSTTTPFYLGTNPQFSVFFIAFCSTSHPVLSVRALSFAVCHSFNLEWKKCVSKPTTWRLPLFNGSFTAAEQVLPLNFPFEFLRVLPVNRKRVAFPLHLRQQIAHVGAVRRRARNGEGRSRNSNQIEKREKLLHVCTGRIYWSKSFKRWTLDSSLIQYLGKLCLALNSSSG